MSDRETLDKEAPCSCGKKTILRTQVDLRSCGATVCRVEHAFPEAKYREVLVENERLREGKQVYRLAAEGAEARIDAVLALCDSVDSPRGDRLVTIESVRKALKGEKP